MDVLPAPAGWVDPIAASSTPADVVAVAAVAGITVAFGAVACVLHRRDRT